ncbi:MULTISPECIES: tRNA glutamyl-Q(34) synthetase GluQRS [unclassified Sphingomonas]|jgi:glutamyl-Q tRNA(Asp) synthetase|uniref:tRNA glutamyl-Q(34) synthetase GluQRS n=1 Tax=unclassified Sphingomonas TaxID=196159 RepID=UPI00083386FD|nr:MULTISPECIES: tRNA glutamyl-Q(34) synthetase GluQRS [unclassified Sphingomonas]
MSEPIVSRFAPSPTGRLHLGHALSAVRAHDLARAAGGRFLVRIEDIDATRSRPEHVDAILADLAALGLGWDGPVWYQSQRLDAYAAALDQLRDAGLLYPCFCTRADIAREVAASLSAPHGPDGPVYPGTCRALPPGLRAERLARDPHSWRLDMAAAVARVGPLDWHDATAGTIRADPLGHGDVVLARKDAPASYHLAVTVDDAAQGVSDVVRGRDLFAATHVHRLLQALLGLAVPRYHHHPLIVSADGRRLAKRDGAPTLDRFSDADGRLDDLAQKLRAGRLPLGFALATA